MNKPLVNTWWDGCNKWLYIGTKEGQNNQFTLTFDNWNWFSRQPTIRQWKLFEIMWDNGAWWGDLSETKEISIPHMNGQYIETDDFIIRSGDHPCFVQVTIMGIGLRYNYQKHMSIRHRKQNEDEIR